MSVLERPKFTADDLLTMPDGDWYELVDGELREVRKSTLSSWVAGEVYCRVQAFVEDHSLGWAFPGGLTFQCFDWDSELVRKVDVSFIPRGRLPNGPTETGHTRVVPDLAVEVVSADDSADELAARVADFLRAGVPTVWVVNPYQRTVTIYRSADPSSSLHLSAEDRLAGDGPLEGFDCRVAELFPPIAAEA